MCFECFESKPARGWRAIGFNKHLLPVILRISLMRIMKSSETLGDRLEKKWFISGIFLNTFFPYSTSPSGIFSAEAKVFCIWVGFWGAWVTSPQVLSSASSLPLPLGWPLWFLVPGLSYVLVYFLWKLRSSKAGNAHSLDLSSSNVVIRGTKARGMYYHGECHCLLTYVGSAVSLGFMSLCWLFSAWRSASCAALTDRKCACLPSCPPLRRKTGRADCFPLRGFLEILPKFIPSYLKIKKRNTFLRT